MTASTTIEIATGTLTELAAQMRVGEIYAGTIPAIDDQPEQHIFLLEGETTGDQESCAAWAESLGGELPTLAELASLRANCGMHFQSTWYWSAERDPVNSDIAGMQNFGNGEQMFFTGISSRGARAVRRLIFVAE